MAPWHNSQGFSVQALAYPAPPKKRPYLPCSVTRALPLCSSQRHFLLIHGSCQSDRQWLRRGCDHGAALSRDLGYTPVYLRYNTGLHISTNGRKLAALLDQLVAAWPVPQEEFVILAHSMGGLVARSACHMAEEQNYPWRSKLGAMIFLGTPHPGAPFERGGNWIDQLLIISRYSAPFARLGKIRSAGVTDHLDLLSHRGVYLKVRRWLKTGPGRST